MQNAHLRMGKLTLVRQTATSSTHVTVGLDRLVADVSSDGKASGVLHLVSVFGGDQEISAIAAAAVEEYHFQIDAHDSRFIGTLGEKPISYRASLQIPGRRRPVRHLILVSKELFQTTFGANGEARRTILYDSSPEFVLHRLAVRFGLPVLPEWAQWFHEELRRRGMVEELIGMNCSPIAVKGTKLRMLRLLSQGLRRRAIQVPSPLVAPEETGLEPLLSLAIDGATR